MANHHATNTTARDTPASTRSKTASAQAPPGADGHTTRMAVLDVCEIDDEQR
jgi:hypothetical protein